MAAGCDMLMVCAHFTDTDRARRFAEAIVGAIEQGRLDEALLARSRARIEALLEQTPMNEVRRLPDEALRAHSAAAALYTAPTVEVV